MPLLPNWPFIELVLFITILLYASHAHTTITIRFTHFYWLFAFTFPLESERGVFSSLFPISLVGASFFGCWSVVWKWLNTFVMFFPITQLLLDSLLCVCVCPLHRGIHFTYDHSWLLVFVSFRLILNALHTNTHTNWLHSLEFNIILYTTLDLAAWKKVTINRNPSWWRNRKTHSIFVAWFHVIYLAFLWYANESMKFEQTTLRWLRFSNRA